MEEEEDIVLCTVEKISGTTVFVKIEDTDKEATIMTSEIAPGRIRNLRDYVVPGKKIVCKILDIDKSGNIHLSLRRVTAKEKKETLEKYQKEKSSLSILKSVLKDKAVEIAEKIKSKEKNLYDFFQSCKEKPELLEKYMPKEEAKKICKILSEKKEKEKQVKKQFTLTSKKENGLSIIKKILLPYKEKINYISAGKFLLKTKADNYKKANSEIETILQDVEEKAKKENCTFKAEEK